MHELNMQTALNMYFFGLIKALYGAFMGLAHLQQIFDSINLSDLGQKSNNDLDPWYSLCIHVLI